MDLNSHYQRYGYIHIKNVLTRDEVSEMRAYVHELFEREQRQHNETRVRFLGGEHALTDPQLYSVMFHDKIVHALSQILEPNFSLIPDHLVSRNVFGFSESGGWHWDSSSEGKQPYLYEPEYRFVKCGLFLQDNTDEFGGGIDFVPGGHRWPLKTSNIKLNFRAKYVADQLGKMFLGKRAPIEAGDFLAFSSCMSHKSTLPHSPDLNITDEDRRAGHIANMPKDKAKIIFYWDACRTRYAADFLENNAGRAIREELDNTSSGQTFYSYFTSRRFPEDYPADFVRRVEAAGIRLPNLPIERTQQIANRLRQRLGAAG